MENEQDLASDKASTVHAMPKRETSFELLLTNAEIEALRWLLKRSVPEHWWTGPCSAEANQLISVCLKLESLGRPAEVPVLHPEGGHGLRRCLGSANGEYTLQCFCGFDTGVREHWLDAAMIFNRHLAEHGLAPKEGSYEKRDSDTFDGGPHGLAGPDAA
jgi:hypothetical protein